MDPVRELPYWPAAVALLIKAGQMTASDYVPNAPIYRLHPKGRPQKSFRIFADPIPLRIKPFRENCVQTHKDIATVGAHGSNPDSISSSRSIV